MAFRKDRVRVVTVFPIPQISEQQLSENVQNFLRLPIAEKNLLKFDLSVANEALDQTLQSLGLQKPALNCVVIVEAETQEKINEIVRDPAFQKIFQAANQGGLFDPSSSSTFSADFMTSLDK